MRTFVTSKQPVVAGKITQSYGLQSKMLLCDDHTTKLLIDGSTTTT